MPYAYATEDQDYSDYSSGRVIYNLPGAPAFPVRLASEIFQRGWAMLRKPKSLSLYDPCCGGAYHLTVLGFLHGESIRRILASDVDPQALSLARRNLGLLTMSGLAAREQEINRLYQQYGKQSHLEAAQSVKGMRKQLNQTLAGEIPSRVFEANTFNSLALQKELKNEVVDLVICDIPYGWRTNWQVDSTAAAEESHPALWRMLDALSEALQAETLVAIASDKAQKAAHEAYRRTAQFQIGKRQVTFLKIN